MNTEKGSFRFLRLVLPQGQAHSAQAGSRQFGKELHMNCDMNQALVLRLMKMLRGVCHFQLQLGCSKHIIILVSPGQSCVSPVPKRIQIHGKNLYANTLTRRTLSLMWVPQHPQKKKKKTTSAKVLETNVLEFGWGEGSSWFWFGGGVVFWVVFFFLFSLSQMPHF